MSENRHSLSLIMKESVDLNLVRKGKWLGIFHNLIKVSTSGIKFTLDPVMNM